MIIYMMIGKVPNDYCTYGGAHFEALNCRSASLQRTYPDRLHLSPVGWRRMSLTLARVLLSIDKGKVNFKIK